MNTKLTLSIDNKVIEKAKNYAKNHKKSLSSMVEEYFSHVVNDKPEKEEKIEITPMVRSIFAGKTLPTNLDWKKEKEEYLTKKYGL